MSDDPADLSDETAAVPLDSYTLVASEIALHLVGNRTNSTALLAWFLEAVWRLDPDVASDAICDGGGDKGIDALHVDDDSKEIVVFQTKHRNTPSVTQGDNDLKAFIGTSVYFDDEAGVRSLLDSRPNEEVRNLIERLSVQDKVASGDYSIRLVFITNGVLDASGASYVSTRQSQAPALDVWDRERLAGIAARTAVLRVGEVPVTLTATSAPIIADLDSNVRMAVALVSAPDLVRLPGIDDLSVFELNVRLGLGRTRINKQLADTVRDKTEHKLFVTYHNGMTLLTRRFEAAGNELNLTGVSVVNGCQSLLALYGNRAHLTPDLQILVRVVELGTQGDLVDRITYRTNNQNAVSIRDQRSTDRVQRGLQAELRDEYGTELSLAIRSGEQLEGEVIENSFLAQLVMATYVGEPWNAVRKVRLFDEDYYRIFRKDLTAHRIVLLHEIDKALLRHRDRLMPALNAAYSSVRFTLTFLVSRLLSITDEGKVFLESPGPLLKADRSAVALALDDLAVEAIDSTNHFITSKEDEARQASRSFDPKVAFKSRASVTQIERDAVSFADRSIRRDPGYGFRLTA